MGHHFNPDIAERYGLEEAILFENIYSWCEQNRADNKNFIDGRFWTYNSVKTLATIFKYMTEKQVASSLRNLGLSLQGITTPIHVTELSGMRFLISDFHFTQNRMEVRHDNHTTFKFRRIYRLF